MPDVIVVGDGPAGLSAALFLAKKDLDVVVFGKDETLMHKAVLYNYLGIPKMSGSEFQRISRAQVEGFGGQIRDDEITAAEKTETGFAVTTSDGQGLESKYLILCTGPSNPLAEAFAVGKEEDGLAADRNGRTHIPGLYAVGWSTRLKKIQAIISAGEGAIAALDILSAEAGEDIHDFDLVEE